LRSTEDQPVLYEEAIGKCLDPISAKWRWDHYHRSLFSEKVYTLRTQWYNININI